MDKTVSCTNSCVYNWSWRINSSCAAPHTLLARPCIHLQGSPDAVSASSILVSTLRNLTSLLGAPNFVAASTDVSQLPLSAAATPQLVWSRRVELDDTRSRGYQAWAACVSVLELSAAALVGAMVMHAGECWW